MLADMETDVFFVFTSNNFEFIFKKWSWSWILFWSVNTEHTVQGLHWTHCIIDFHSLLFCPSEKRKKYPSPGADLRLSAGQTLSPPASLSLLSSSSVFCQVSRPLAQGWHQVARHTNQHNAPHSPITHPVPCEPEERAPYTDTSGAGAGATVAPPGAWYTCVPVDGWMNECTVRCWRKRSSCSQQLSTHTVQSDSSALLVCVA